ncbi:hypothetical protein [Pseudomonas aegrilactucae]|uniref:Uncharacterized protein n=1 Tax=Pseudomonas aegrilactucae TaxID=2854028 RepID=A0A9Q2XGZ7_9PSED|nr:hypothetical protein [Pseudomonas aegrilactucae]MBV6286536.1 hypothetical protein [Pseudomonas aegrilactucae]
METQYQTWVNGAQLISFPAGVSASAANDVLNSHLLAQVCANQDGVVTANPRAWFQRSVDGLAQLMWSTQSTQSDVSRFGNLDDLSIVALVAKHLRKKLPTVIFKQMTGMLEQICELDYEHPARQLFRTQVLDRNVGAHGTKRTAINFQLSACTAPDQVFSLFVSLTLAVPLQQDFLHQAFYGVDSPGDGLFFYSHKELSVARYARLREMTVAALAGDAVSLRQRLPVVTATPATLEGGANGRV